MQTWKHDKVAAGLFIPYAARVAFATALNGSIAVMIWGSAFWTPSVVALLSDALVTFEGHSS